MSVSRCPNCGMPFEADGYYTQGTATKCRHCGYSGQALSSAFSLYKKTKVQHKEADPFKEELGLEPFSSKLAFVSLFIFFVSLSATGPKAFALASFFGFVMFSAFYAFLRIRNSR